jgi:OPA family glycerol-3-phosphate transporter-like MFS transporter
VDLSVAGDAFTLTPTLTENTDGSFTLALPPDGDVQSVYLVKCGYTVLTPTDGVYTLPEGAENVSVTGALLVVGFGILERRHPGQVRDALAEKTVEPIQENETAVPAQKSESLWHIIITSGLLFVFVMTATVGFLRDGIEEWMSTYLYDTFSLRADLSTLTNIFMPVFGLICVRFAAMLHLRIIKDEIREVTVLISTCAAATLALALFHALHPAFSLVMIVLSVGCIHAANTSLTCYLPARFVKSGKVSTVSGLVNAFTYVGSTLATSAVPWLFEATSWQVTIFSWCAVGMICLAACVLITRTWRKFLKENKQ